MWVDQATNKASVADISPKQERHPKLQRHDPIQKAAKCINSLKLNNTFGKSKFKFVAMHYRYTDEFPVSSE
ncbi:hypothetical protein Tco_0631678 [Tanacetum coccineum]